MKKLIFTVIMLTAFTGGAVNASVSMNMPIDIMVNGSYIKTDARPFLVSGTTYVPVRFIGEALGAGVSWIEGSRTAVISDGETKITMQIGDSFGYVNESPIFLANGIRLVNGRTFVPVRFISEALGAGVSWDGEHLTVIIDKSGAGVAPGLVYNRGYSNEDVYWLGRIINAEAQGEPMQGKIGVGNVILNRVNSADFPDTVHDVIFDTKFGVQFTPTINGRIYETPSFESLVAAKYCLQGESAVGESLFFLNPETASSLWITNARQHYATVGNHSFYL